MFRIDKDSATSKETPRHHQDPYSARIAINWQALPGCPAASELRSHDEFYWSELCVVIPQRDKPPFDS